MTAKWILGTTLLLLSACGGNEAAQTTPASANKTADAPKAAPTKAPKAVASPAPTAKAAAAGAKVTVNAAGEAELTIEATDAMQFNAKKFTVTAGQKVKLTLKHVGKLPKNVMGHNLVILKPNVDIAKFVAASQAASKTDYFPKEKADQTIAHTKLLGGGETATVEFVAPAAGTYKFICSFSSHWSMMKGDMVVVAKK